MITSPLLRSGRAEAQTLTGEAAGLRETQEGRRLLLLDAGALIAHCSEYPDTVRRRWKAFQQEAEGRVLFEDDMAPSFALLISLAETCREAVAAVRESLEEAERSRPDLETQDERAYAAPNLTPLESAAERLAALRSEISAQWEWLKAPDEPHRPLRTTEEIRAARRRGESISVEEAIARIAENLPEVP